MSYVDQIYLLMITCDNGGTCDDMLPVHATRTVYS